MIPPELEARILRLHEVEKWPIGTIAREVGVHHTVVRRVLRQAGQLELPKPSSRPSILDDYMPFIRVPSLREMLNSAALSALAPLR